MAKPPLDLGAMVKQLEGMPQAELDALMKSVTEAPLIWHPTVGPQYNAYFSLADELLYGGAGGGGKSDLVLGLAFTAHWNSLILRRQYVDLGGMIERALEINGTRDGYSGAVPPRLYTTGGRRIVFGAHKELGDEQSFQGQPFDLKCFDEAVQHLESQVQFHLGWLRSTRVNPDGTLQRCRAILASNPPIDAAGYWIVGRYRPWLDLNYPENKRAKAGELRWFITNPDGEDQEVDGPTPIEFTVKGKKETFRPTSRTFIPAFLEDNPFLINSNYRAQQDALPEPLRSAVRDGNFMAVRADTERQVIPTQWVIEAQGRWTRDGRRGRPMTAMGYDPSGGGKDPAMLAMRHGPWYAPLIERKGAEAADGSMTVGFLFQHRRDLAEIVIDVGGGYASSTRERLKENGAEHTPFDGNGVGEGRDKSGLLTFTNRRAKAWWRFREALDPDQIGGSEVLLPDDQQLRAELTAPTFKVDKSKITIESKDDIRKRIGRSTNRADAVIMCWSDADASIKRRLDLGQDRRARPTYARSTRQGPLQRRRAPAH